MRGRVGVGDIVGVGVIGCLGESPQSHYVAFKHYCLGLPHHSVHRYRCHSSSDNQ